MFLLKMFKLPQGFVGAAFIIFGIFAALNFDAENYALENSLYAKTQKEAVEIYKRNENKKSEKDQAILIILCSLGIGTLQLGNAAWVANKRESKLNRMASISQGAVRSAQIVSETDFSIDDSDFDIDVDVDAD